MMSTQNPCPACMAGQIERKIIDALHRYCLAVDEGHEQQFLGLWTKDALIDFGVRYRGDPAGFFDSVRANRAATIAMSHHLANIRVQIDGDVQRAASSCGVTAVVIPNAHSGRRPRMVRGNYHDRWLRRGDDWLIQHRRFEKVLEVDLGHGRLLPRRRSL